MFIDTALSRKSVVSHAKLLGYTPRSATASRASINVAFTPVTNDSNSAISIPRFTRFLSESKDGVNYVFVTTSSRVLTKNNSTGLFSADALEVKEGQPLAITFTYDSQTNIKQIFEIPEFNVDTSTVQVRVQKSAENANQETYILAQNATDVDANAAVYYIEENKNGKYQIYFGDGVIGKKLTNGNIVIVSYIVTSGAAANGLKTFRLVDTVLPGSTVAVTLDQESTSGTPIEDIEKIRFTAPKAFISQNRAVTKNDYVALLNRDYPYFEAVNVWGGEENDPPVYGKVFFTAKPLGGFEITLTEIEFVKNNILKPFSVLTVTPEYVAADYNYLNLDVDVNYDPTRTTKTLNEIQASVISSIQNFASQNLNTFNNSFKISKLSRAIDDADPSITNNNVRVVLEKRVAVDTTRSADYTFNYGVELKQGTTTERVTSSPTFSYVDNGGVQRDGCFVEEVLQSFTGIESISILAGGSGFTSTPTIVIEGDGTNAVAQATIVNGSIRSIEITNPGDGYTSATARVVGGGGSGALLRPVLEGRNGILKIFYYDENGIKKTLQENAGSIDYRTGRLILDNFSPVAISDPFGTFILKAIPLRNIFSSEKNRIITLDNTDPGALRVYVEPIVE
jgi:hypothetical protein